MLTLQDRKFLGYVALMSAFLKDLPYRVLSFMLISLLTVVCLVYSATYKALWHLSTWVDGLLGKTVVSYFRALGW